MTIEVEVPFELHRYIIGQKGSGIRKMMDEFEVSLALDKAFCNSGKHFCTMWCIPFIIFLDGKYEMCCINMRFLGANFNKVFIHSQVNIQVPAPELQSDIISITGLATHLDRAKEGLLERVKELQAEQEDRVNDMSRVCD